MKEWGLGTTAASGSSVVVGEEMIRCRVNGQDLEVKKGSTVLDACKAAKQHLSIPTLCYHPMLRTVGTCRLCLVELSNLTEAEREEVKIKGKGAVVYKKKTLVPSCCTELKDGMDISTNTEVTEEAGELPGWY